MGKEDWASFEIASYPKARVTQGAGFDSEEQVQPDTRARPSRCASTRVTPSRVLSLSCRELGLAGISGHRVPSLRGKHGPCRCLAGQGRVSLWAVTSRRPGRVLSKSVNSGCKGPGDPAVLSLALPPRDLGVMSTIEMDALVAPVDA